MKNITPTSIAASAALEQRLGLRVGAALTARLAADPTPDIDERLRFARERALDAARASRRVSAAAAQSQVLANGRAAVLGGDPKGVTPWWLRLSAVLPLVVLIAGLAWIDHRYTRDQIEAAAEVDAAILADDLPPDAYRDPGFVEFLKSARR